MITPEELAMRGRENPIMYKREEANAYATSSALVAGVTVDMTNTPPFAVAALRGALTAMLTGATVFLATWTTTDNPKLLAIATATAVVSVLISRLGAEGVIDQAKANSTK